MAHYIDEREQRRLNRARLIEEAERQRRIEEDIWALQHQREQLLVDRARRRETDLFANAREESQLLDYEDPHMTLDEYYLADNPDRVTESLIGYRQGIQQGYERDQTQMSQTRDMDREIVSDRHRMDRESPERKRDTNQSILSQLDAKERNKRLMKEKEEKRKAVAQESGSIGFKEMQSEQSRENEQTPSVYEQNRLDDRGMDSSCARRYNRNYNERQSASHRTPEPRDECLKASSKKGDMLNVLDREIEELDRKLSLMNTDTRSLLDRSAEKMKTEKEKWDVDYVDRPGIRTMSINTRQEKKGEIEEERSNDRVREDIFHRDIYTDKDERKDHQASTMQPDYFEYERELPLDSRYSKPYTNKPSLARRKLEYEERHIQMGPKQGYLEGSKSVLPVLDKLPKGGHTGIESDHNPVPLERTYENISGYKPYPEVLINKPYYPYGYMCKQEFTGKTLPEVRQTDTRDKIVIERRMRKEQMLKAQEEELRRKEIELQEREHWIKCQEQVELEIETTDPYEELLNEKERKMKLKLEELTKKEKQRSEPKFCHRFTGSI